MTSGVIPVHQKRGMESIGETVQKRNKSFGKMSYRSPPYDRTEAHGLPSFVLPNPPCIRGEAPRNHGLYCIVSSRSLTS